MMYSATWPKEVKQLAEEFGLTFLEGSAKLYKNVDEAFYELVRIVRKERGWVKKPTKGKTGSSKTGGGDSGKKKGCTLL